MMLRKYSEKPELIHNDMVRYLRENFFHYVQTFKKGDEAFQQNIVLKEEHTKRVCKEILSIGEQLGLNDDEQRLAEIIALFHDIGRFEQYARYKTFKDGCSENHAKLGIKVLKRQGFLNQMEESTRSLIFRTIQYHNRAVLPQDETKRCLFFSRLLRDADKLDIWKVIINYYQEQQQRGGHNGVLELGLPDTPGFSDGVYRNLISRDIVDIRHIRNLNDYKLFMIGWVFDINFETTLRAVCSRHYLDMIRDVLPKSDKVDEIFTVIDSYLGEKLKVSEV